MRIEKTSTLKLYKRHQNRPSRKLVIFGHGSIEANDRKSFIPNLQLSFYVEHGYVLLSINHSLANDISKKYPFYEIGYGESVPDYVISKFRGAEGAVHSNHYSDDYYCMVCRATGVDILRVRQKLNNNKQRLSQIIKFAEDQGYTKVFGFHCRFVIRQFNSTKQLRLYEDELRSRPKYKSYDN